MFVKCSSIKHSGDVATQIEKAIPKLATIYKKIEQAHLKDSCDDAELLALAKKVSDMMRSHDESETWFNLLEQAQKKFDGMDGAKKRKF
jgi:hypothetical protein